MSLVYFSHSYRVTDDQINRHFLRLMSMEGVFNQLDPPTSQTVNAAKLERGLRSSDGMVAVINRREVGGVSPGVSPHILFEISLCMRARKPLLVFVEDTIPGNVLPPRILQARFSRRSFLRQFREHRHAIQVLNNYLGQGSLPQYQPSSDQRSCLLIGSSNLPEGAQNVIEQNLHSHGYVVRKMDTFGTFPIHDERVIEAVASADLAVCLVGPGFNETEYVLGVIQTIAIPSIMLTTAKHLPVRPYLPAEYRPRFIDPDNVSSVETVLKGELSIAEQDFVELDNKDKVEQYYTVLTNATSARGRYGDRDQLIANLAVSFGDTISVGNLSNTRGAAIGRQASSTVEGQTPG